MNWFKANIDEAVCIKFDRYGLDQIVAAETYDKVITYVRFIHVASIDRGPKQGNTGITNILQVKLVNGL
jgi:hypothetical protein